MDQQTANLVEALERHIHIAKQCDWWYEQLRASTRSLESLVKTCKEVAGPQRSRKGVVSGLAGCGISDENHKHLRLMHLR